MMLEDDPARLHQRSAPIPKVVKVLAKGMRSRKHFIEVILYEPLNSFEKVQSYRVSGCLLRLASKNVLRRSWSLKALRNESDTNVFQDCSTSRLAT